MSEQLLRDRNYRLIARIITRTDGKIEIRDPAYKFLGIYEPVTDRTLDRTYRFVGSGNLLTSLL